MVLRVAMRSRVVVGNWKLNGSLAGNEQLLKQLLAEIPQGGPAACAVCVPYAYLAQARDVLKGSSIGWGSQDCSRFEKGAYTGDVSAKMVAEFGSRHAIVGHSERRTIFGDTDAIVVEKYAQAKRAGLTPSSAWAKPSGSANRTPRSRYSRGRWMRCSRRNRWRAASSPTSRCGPSARGR